MTNKPKWVEALESAERSLNTASASQDFNEAHAHCAIADKWIAVARLYQGEA